MKSCAIINHNTVPGECIHLFEKLATPRPAPKVTLKSNWLVQEQQQPIRKKDVKSNSKEVATWKAEQERGMKRETPQEWKKPLETVGGPMHS